MGVRMAMIVLPNCGSIGHESPVVGPPDPRRSRETATCRSPMIPRSAALVLSHLRAVRAEAPANLFGLGRRRIDHLADLGGLGRRETADLGMLPDHRLVLRNIDQDRLVVWA